MDINEIKIGAKVMTSGYRGTITRICEWSRTPNEIMVEVRLVSGTTCVSSRDIIAYSLNSNRE